MMATMHCSEPQALFVQCNGAGTSVKRVKVWQFTLRRRVPESDFGTDFFCLPLETTCFEVLPVVRVRV